MKTSLISSALVTLVAAMAGNTYAQQSGNQVRWQDIATRTYYAQEDPVETSPSDLPIETSPSDLPVDPKAKPDKPPQANPPDDGAHLAPAAAAPMQRYAPAATAPAVCDSGCAGNGCASGCCDSGCGCSCYMFGSDEAWELTTPTDCRRMKIGGWLQMGYHSQQTPLSTARGDLGAFNDVPNDVNLQQAYIYIEQVADGDCGCWDWGYRADFLYGTDAQKTQAFGGTGFDNSFDNGVYGWAIPQAYLELDNGAWNFKIGHFYTLVGYEVVTAPGNFFYSHAYTMFNTEPFTHTGVIGSYEASDNLTIYSGYTLGWDTGFERFQGGSNAIGGFAWTMNDQMTLTYIMTAGDFGLRGQGYSHSVVFDYVINDCWEYVLQTDHLNAQTANNVQDVDTGINQYLFYTTNDCTKFGTRLEWWKNDGVSNYEATIGLNYSPHANLIVRPELRRDWTPANNFKELTFGVDAILTF